MKAASKTILFCRVISDKKTHFYPVATFANDASAKAYAVKLYQAHAASNKDAAMALDAATVLDPEGNLAAGAKWSIKAVAYEPGVTEDVPAGFTLEP